MLKNLTIQDIDGGLNLVDVGCSGDLDEKWAPVSGLINYVGFDPNAEECDRLNSEPSKFHSRLFLPFAVHDGGEHTLHITESIYCYSLLKPNQAWLDRFAYRDLFRVKGTEPFPTSRMDDIEGISGMDVDAIKLDSQGLDKCILEHGENILSKAIYVEAEPGFLENYTGENTFSEVDIFLRERGFLLFDLELYRQPRANGLGKACPKQQLLWCQGVWMHDLVAHPMATPARGKALKALLLCAVCSFHDFGFELAERFNQMELITNDELKSLSSQAAWEL